MSWARVGRAHRSSAKPCRWDPGATQDELVKSITELETEFQKRPRTLISQPREEGTLLVHSEDMKGADVGRISSRKKEILNPDASREELKAAIGELEAGLGLEPESRDRDGTNAINGHEENQDQELSQGSSSHPANQWFVVGGSTENHDRAAVLSVTSIQGVVVREPVCGWNKTKADVRMKKKKNDLSKNQGRGTGRGPVVPQAPRKEVQDQDQIQDRVQDPEALMLEKLSLERGPERRE